MKYFIIYLFLEVIISVNISSYIGGLATFFEIIASALLGIAILSNFRKTLVENLRAVSSNHIDLREFQKLNLFTLIGAILLIIPGFFTDAVGVILQFSVFTTMLVNRYSVKSESYKTSYNKNDIKKDSDVIDVEIITEHTTIK
ncbi:MAG: FxsA family protein [Campylobacterota bacterium]|nr:FxsA family protein [Campylobacterota bacterium]